MALRAGCWPESVPLAVNVRHTRDVPSPRTLAAEGVSGVMLGVPVLTLALAAASGTLESPDDGWLTEGWSYLLATLIYPALLINVWEEAAWAGFVQARLMGRHGLMMAPC